MQTHNLSLPVLRRRKSRMDRIKETIIAAIPFAAAKKAVPDGDKDESAHFAANTAGPVSPPATPTV